MRKITCVLIIFLIVFHVFAQVRLKQEKVVNNLRAPKDGSDQYLLKEELSIGENGGDSNYCFSKISALYVDDYENIYLIEGNERQVRVFDKYGKFKRKFGRKGRGPGEWIYPTYVYVKDSVIYVVDGGNIKISQYDLNGRFLTDLRVDVGAIPGAIFIDTAGDYIIFCIKITVNGDRCKIVKIDNEGEVISKSESMTWQKREFVSTDKGTVGIPSPFAPCGYIAYNKNTDCIYYGFSGKYAISVFDVDFNKVMIIKKQSPSVKISSSEKRDYINSYMEKGRSKHREDFYKWRKKYIKFPPNHPFFNGIWINDKENLLVKRITSDKKVHLDVFNKDGIYIREIILSPPEDDIVFESIFDKYTFFVNNSIYSIVENNEGFILFKKYSLIQRN